jgi:regulator of replication initiation timing
VAGRQNAIAQKHHPQPAAENAAAKDVANFASNLQWGRERPATTPDRATAVAPPQKSRRAVAPGDVPETMQLPMVAESKHRKARSKSAPRPATSASAPAADGAKDASKKSARESENHRNLLQHVKKVRSDQQLQAMIEYLQAGFIKIENLSLEKRRIKKLIKAWNTSFEKKNSRVPTSGERKGHLRELYEEYHQVCVGTIMSYMCVCGCHYVTFSSSGQWIWTCGDNSYVLLCPLVFLLLTTSVFACMTAHQVSLALRIRVEKMEDSLRTVGLTQEEFIQLRDKKLSDW